MHRAKLPRLKPVMLIQDYPILSEIDIDEPYSAASNLSFLSSLYKVGIKQSDIELTYLSYSRPTKENFDWKNFFKKHKQLSDFEIENQYTRLKHQKDLFVDNELWQNFQSLLDEIKLVKPKLIIITGKWSLFLLTGLISYIDTQSRANAQKPLGGITKYRASIMNIWKGFHLEPSIVIPVYPGVVKQRDPSKVPIMTWDFKKLGDVFESVVVKQEPLIKWTKPQREAIICDSLEVTIYWLTLLLIQLELAPLKVSIDIETKMGTIDCIGFSWCKHFGVCVPFLTELTSSCWTFDEELEITLLINKILEHKNLQVVGQNFSYDSAWFSKYNLINLNPTLDTMILNHVLYNYMQKDLGFLASVYCNTFIYWKGMQEHVAEGVK